jgi:beta-glucanase (GH16 family)
VSRLLPEICLVFAVLMAPLECGAEVVESLPAAAFDPADPAASGYTLVFEDEFVGASLDQSKWTPLWGWDNGINNTYPDNEALPANVTIGNGIADFAVTPGPTPAGRAYGTAVATSRGKFSQRYGYFEASIKMPHDAHGLWPAFWMVPTDLSWPPEIDIVEWLGTEPTTDYMTLHYGTAKRHRQWGTTYTGPDFSANFHKFGLLWTPRSVTWYVDGVVRATTSTQIPSAVMYLILNNNTGGWNGNAVDSTTIFPAVFSVDYVRVYRPPQ